jgi:hypothetical protein
MRRISARRNLSSAWILLGISLFAPVSLPAQFGGGYPPGYPSGRPRFPGGVGVPGIPLPGGRSGRRQTDKPAPEETVPEVHYTARLTSLDRNFILLKLDDGRPLRMDRTGKTKFYKDSKKAKASDFGPGDHVSVDATEDQQGFLYALNVTLEKAATDEERAEALKDAAHPASESAAASSSGPDNNGHPTLKRANTQKSAETASEGTEAANSANSAGAAPGDGKSAPTEVSRTPLPEGPSPRNPDYEAEGSPRLNRRVPPAPEPPPAPEHKDSPERTGARPASSPVAAATVASSRPRFDTSQREDPLIEKARLATFSFSDKLPNFICQEYMSRFARYSNAKPWQPLDVISAEIIYNGGQESYRNLKINDRPTDKKMEELSGSWSTGEFASTLNDLFHPATDARFRFGGESNLLNLHARVYDFDVEQANSHWRVQMGSQTIEPAFKGSVWIDPETGRVLRVEIQARDIPASFPMDAVESAVDYSWVRIAGDQVLLPVHAESLGCERGTASCSRNIIDFRGYRKYTADSKIIFDPEPEPQPERPAP